MKFKSYLENIGFSQISPVNYELAISDKNKLSLYLYENGSDIKIPYKYCLKLLSVTSLRGSQNIIEGFYFDTKEDLGFMLKRTELLTFLQGF